MSYSINLLWVNLDPQDREANRAENIFGDGLSTDKQDHFFDAAKQWRHLNPEARVYLWFDSALVTQVALDNTRKRFREIGVELGDVRHLPNLKGELECAMHPGVPVYFRVDVLKELIGSYMAQEKNDYAVFTDLDVKPMDKATLFDEETKGHLETHGYVYNAAGISGIENSFFIYKNSPFIKEHTNTFLRNVSDRIKNPPDPYKLLDGVPDNMLTSNAVFHDLCDFLKRYEGKRDIKPRKQVECPESQFAPGGGFEKDDHRREMACFLMRKTFPVSLYGRGGKKHGEPLFRKWKAKPLP